MSGQPMTTGQRRRVVELVEAGARDAHIAAEVDISRISVRRIRDDHNLPANYKPGRPRREEPVR